MWIFINFVTHTTPIISCSVVLLMLNFPASIFKTFATTFVYNFMAMYTFANTHVRIIYSFHPANYEIYGLPGIHLCPQRCIPGRNLRCPYDWLDSTAFRIRHYRSKSLEEYVERRIGADAAYQAKHYTREKLTSEWYETNAQCGKAGR